MAVQRMPGLAWLFSGIIALAPLTFFVRQVRLAFRMLSAILPGMGKDNFRMIVVRRAPVRETLKPLRAAWLECGSDPDWAAIAEVTGPKGYEAFELLLLKRSPSACVTAECQSTGRKVARVASISYDTLQITKDQAHADLGINYVEWEPCQVEITGEDGRVYFEKALPIAEVDAPNERR